MNFGFLLFPGVEEFDFVDPWETIGMWSMHFAGPDALITLSESDNAIRCAKGLTVAAEHRFGDCSPLDYPLVPGGRGTHSEVENAGLPAFVREQSTSCRHVLGVCAGTFILQAAGVLRGKKATTHWRSLDRLRRFSEVQVPEERVVRDGSMWTTASVSAGSDLALALIADQAGEEAAGKVQLAAEYRPSQRRYGAAHVSTEVPGIWLHRNRGKTLRADDVRRLVPARSSNDAVGPQASAGTAMVHAKKGEAYGQAGRHVSSQEGIAHEAAQGGIQGVQGVPRDERGRRVGT